jgi:hypothetical protein
VARGQWEATRTAAAPVSFGGLEKKLFFTDIHRYSPLSTYIHRYWLEPTRMILGQGRRI